jgi:hypothetical protein
MPVVIEQIPSVAQNIGPNGAAPLRCTVRGSTRTEGWEVTVVHANRIVWYRPCVPETRAVDQFILPRTVASKV